MIEKYQSNIMMDYDNTYTRDIIMWRQLIALMIERGHMVYLITSRGGDTPIEDQDWWDEMQIPIIYCDYYAKKDIAENMDIHIDIWIDDNPRYIEESYR